MIRFHYYFATSYDTAAGMGRVSLLCGAEQGGEYITRNLAAVTCDDCTVMLDLNAAMEQHLAEPTS